MNRLKERLQCAIPLTCVVLLVLFLWRDVVFNGRYLFLDDITTLTNPFWRYIKSAVAEGEFPLWSSEIFCGFPLASSVQFGPMYPPNYLFYLLLPVGWGTNLTVVLHSVAAGVFFYLFLSRLLAEIFESRREDSHIRWASAGGAILFALNGFVVTYHVAPHGLSTMALAGAVLWSAERYLQRKGPLNLLLTGVFFGLSLLAGHTQHCYYLLMVLVCYSLIKNWKKAPLIIAVTLVIGGGIFSVQALPTIELKELSARSSVGLEHIAEFPRSLWRMFIESSSGSIYGGMRELEWFVYPNFIGIVCWMGAVAGLLTFRRQAVLFFALALLGFFLSLGKNTPIFILAYKVLPQFQIFKSPERASFIFVLSMSVLFSIGLIGFLLNPTKKILCAVLLTASFFTILSLAIYLFEEVSIPLVPGDFVRRQRLKSLVVTVLAGAGTSLCFLLRRPRFALVFCALELLVFSAGVVTTTEVDITSLRPALSRSLSTSDYRILREGGPFAPQRKYLQGTKLSWLGYPLLFTQETLRANETLAPNIPLGFSIKEFFGFSSLTLEKLLEFRAGGRNFNPLYDAYSDRAVLSPGVLRTANCRYVLTTPNLSHLLQALPGKTKHRVLDFLSQSRRVPRLCTEIYDVYELNVPPLVYVPAATRQLEDGDEVLARIRESDFDPRLETLLEVELESSGSAELLYHHSTELILRVAGEGVAVISETAYPGWESWVDGSPTGLLTANYLFKAIPFKKNSTEVRLVYRPRSFKYGLAISLAFAWGVMALLVGRSKWFSGKRDG